MNRADVALLRVVGRLLRGRMGDLTEPYLDRTDEAPDLRDALAGFWLTIWAVVGLPLTLIGTRTAVGRNDVVGLALAGVIAVPAALAMIHGVVEHMKRGTEPIDSDRAFLAVWGPIGLVLWLVFWYFVEP